ncbi:MAG: flagellar assembly protein FliW [Cyanobacteria bacterium P01_H01_bin.74]
MSTITLETKRFGTLEIESSTIIRFKKPILGFEDLREYVLLNHADDSPFKWLQAISRPDLAFVVTNPQFFNIDYAFDIDDDTTALLDLKTADDALVLTMVNIPADAPQKMTTNLLGPLVINKTSLHAAQVVLNDERFQTKTPLISDQQHVGESTEESNPAEPSSPSVPSP